MFELPRLWGLICVTVTQHLAGFQNQNKSHDTSECSINLSIRFNLFLAANMGLMFPIYFISVILTGGLALMSGSQILDLSDLDCDHVDLQTCCANLNRLVIPEIIFVGILVLAHLATMNWIPLATTMPMLSWVIYKYRATPSGYTSLFNPNEMRNEKVLNRHVRHCLIKIVFHILHFFGYLIMAVLTLYVN